MIEKYLTDDLLIVCNSGIKKNILNKYNDKLYNYKFMNKNEFKNHFYFAYDNKTISYLISKYNYNIDVCKIYLDNLYPIDIDKNYKNEKLKFLKRLKIELINEKLLYFDKLFNSYLNTKTVIIIDNNLEKYEKDDFKKFIILDESSQKLECSVTCCNTLEEEILYVIDNILTLVNDGVDLNKIYLTNVGEDYLYTINRLFSYFKIPINLDMRESIYGTKIVKDYLNTKKIPSFKTKIGTKLIEVLNSLVDISDDVNYNIFLTDKLKHTYIPQTKYKNAVNIIDIGTPIEEDDYLFVLGFNQDIIPRTYKNEEYITDSIKDEVNLYLTTEKNIREKKSISNYLGKIKNLFISYKEKSNFNSYLPSSLISDLNLNVSKYDSKKVYNSDLYNKLRLGELLDNYYKYGEKSNLLTKLVSHYDINYNTYDNSFTGINTSSFINYINNYLKLSYTSLNTYNNCAFKYYINYILKINQSKDTFSIFVGNLFHYIFSVMYNECFNFDLEWDSYLEKYELSLKEKFFLKDLKKKLSEDIDIIKDLEMLSEYKNILTEEEVKIKLRKDLEIYFTGKIDKIISTNNSTDTYFSVVDYKTGTINTSINNMKYGLNMQLPIYLYLISKSSIFTSAIFTGMYFQRVLYPNYKWELGKNLYDIKKNNLKLQGYSTDNIENLSKFDRSYESSEMIKSMKINKDGSFSKNSKVLSDDDIYNILKYTEGVIDEVVDNILNAKFDINPKVIEKNKSCTNCEFHDICFVNNKDYIYLDKVDNLDFLGGEDDGNKVD